jgi:hypothetical protein
VIHRQTPRPPPGEPPVVAVADDRWASHHVENNRWPTRLHDTLT